LVWAGMGDEEGFGDDPMMSPWSVGGSEGRGAGSTQEQEVSDVAGSAAVRPRWSRTIISHPSLRAESSGDSPGFDPVPDELQAFSVLQRVHLLRRVLLLHVGRDLGLFYPPHAEVLLLNPDAPGRASVSRCELADVDPRRRYLVRADIGDVNMGAHASDHGW